MSDPVRANILKSKAVMWVAPEGETLPDETDIDAAEDWGGNWERIGYTQSALTLILSDERSEITVEEVLAPIDEWRTSMAATMETSMAELTADYLAWLFGGTVSTTAAGASQKGYEELDIGDQNRITKYAIGFEGIRYDESDNALPVRVFMRRATLKLNGNLEFSQKTDSYTNVPIQVKGFAPDPDSDDSAPVRFQRVTAPASS